MYIAFERFGIRPLEVVVSITQFKVVFGFESLLQPGFELYSNCWHNFSLKENICEMLASFWTNSSWLEDFLLYIFLTRAFEFNFFHKKFQLDLQLCQPKKIKLVVVVMSFIGSVCRTETMHQLLRFKSKFPNHFAFTLGRYLFLLFLIHFI